MRVNTIVRYRVPASTAVLPALLGIFLVAAAGCYQKKPAASNATTKLTSTAPTLHHASQDVLGGSFIVEPGKYKSVKVVVTAGMSKPTVGGTFSATGGNNDIEVFVMEENQFLNWQNGHKADLAYSSGRVTAGKLNIPLPQEPGAYYVVFSNRFSFITNKAVEADLKLQYDYSS